MVSPDTSAPPRVVVVTGVSRYLGARVASRLAADPRVERVIGLDPHEPPAALAGLLGDVELIQADARAATGVLADLGAEALAHLAVTGAPDPQHGGRAAMKEQNVIGTMQLLAAAQGAPRLRKIVVRSSTAAYGASFRDPAVFTEETEPRAVPRGSFARDILDIEGYVRGFRRRRPDVAATVLRFAPLISETADTTLTRYFAQPVVPTVLGRDARLQFVHVDDALEILHRSVTEDHPGTFNVAGAGVLALSQAVRRAGRISLPVPEGADITQSGYEFYPEGLEHCIRKVHTAFRGDIYVTENGIATEDDQRRIEFIQRAIWGVRRCIADDIPVKGYFYWSFIDNYEWQKAYSMKFGLVAADRNTQKRTPKPSLTFLGSMRNQTTTQSGI